MINVTEYIKKAIKKELFKDENLNNSARQILSELKTKYVDIREEITTEIQYKILKKLKAEREKSIEIYSKSDTDLAKANLLKEQMELQIIDIFLFELEKDLPKKMTEEETKEYILYTIESLKMNDPDKFNKGLLMKTLKSNSNIDMSLAAKLLKEMGK